MLTHICRSVRKALRSKFYLFILSRERRATPLSVHILGSNKKQKAKSKFFHCLNLSGSFERAWECGWTLMLSSCVDRWQATVKDGPEVHISHRVTNFEFLYEPFYVAPDTVPPHDERFLGYGYTRNTQVRTCLLFLFFPSSLLSSFEVRTRAEFAMSDTL